MYLLLSGIFSGWNDRARKLTLNPTNKTFLSNPRNLLIFLFLIVISATAVNAATFTVNTLADNEFNGCSLGQCTLRDAIFDANLTPGADTINFQAGLSGTIILNGNALVITSDVTINGPGARNLSVSGNNASRVFVVFGVGNTANISGLTITGGNAQPILFGASLIGDGGGVLNADGATLNLTEVNVSGNSAFSFGGGVATRALLLVTTRTTITRSLISNNTTLAGGGGVSNIGTDLLSGAFTTITNSTITGNNSALEGGGVSNTLATMNLTNNTISHNSSALLGGGIVNVAVAPLGTVNLRNNIIAQNNGVLNTNIISSDGLGIFNSLGNNLVGNNLDIGVSFSASVVIGGQPQPNVNADIVGSVDVGFQIINPQLGALANNGGQTDTRALGAGSLAIDRANNCVLTDTCATDPNPNTLPAALTTDQRGAGFSRSVDGDGDGTAIVDIGAYESQFIPTGTTFTVTNLNDTAPNGCTPGDCTLREAILAANASPGPDTIDFAPALTGTIALTPGFGQLEITTDINIDGPGARVVSVSGEDQTRVFLVAGVGTTATIEGLTITNGNAQPLGTLLGDGGGVLNVGGSTLTLIEVNVSGNTAASLGGGVATRSLLGTTSTTYITRSLISDNNALLGGGGISNIATANIVSSATTTVTNSTVTLNNTLAEAGGVSNVGGTLNLINDTISHNSSTLTGGGVVNVLGLLGLGVTNMRNTIVAYNNATVVGGILNLSDDVLGVFNSLGNNLIGNLFGVTVGLQVSGFIGTTPVPNVNGDIVGSVAAGTFAIDPILESLQNNGGPTDTRAVLSGSPAINRGNNCVGTDTCANDPSPGTLPEALLTDQRSTGFPRIQNGTVEIGAYEILLAPSAANVFVGGQVTDAEGNPVSRATVILMDMSGNIRQTVTNQFGRFQFEDVASGRTYTLSATHKRFEFETQLINIADDVKDISITAVQLGKSTAEDK